MSKSHFIVPPPRRRRHSMKRRKCFSAKLRLLFPPFESLNVGLWRCQRKKDDAAEGRKIFSSARKTCFRSCEALKRVLELASIYVAVSHKKRMWRKHLCSVKAANVEGLLMQCRVDFSVLCVCEAVLVIVLFQFQFFPSLVHLTFAISKCLMRKKWRLNNEQWLTSKHDCLWVQWGWKNSHNYKIHFRPDNWCSRSFLITIGVAKFSLLSFSHIKVGKYGLALFNLPNGDNDDDENLICDNFSIV